MRLREMTACEPPRVKRRQAQALLAQLNVSVFERINVREMTEWIGEHRQRNWARKLAFERDRRWRDGPLSRGPSRTKCAMLLLGLVWLLACVIFAVVVTNTSVLFPTEGPAAALGHAANEAGSQALEASLPWLALAFALFMAWPPLLIWNQTHRQRRYTPGLLARTVGRYIFVKRYIRLLLLACALSLTVLIIAHWMRQLWLSTGLRKLLRDVQKTLHDFTLETDQILLGLQRTVEIIEGIKDDPAQQDAVSRQVIDAASALEGVPIDDLETIVASVRWASLFAEQLCLLLVAVRTVLVFVSHFLAVLAVSMAFAGLYQRRPVTLRPAALVCVGALASSLCDYGLNRAVLTLLEASNFATEAAGLLPRALSQNAPIVAVFRP